MTIDEFKILTKGMKAVYSQPTFLPDRDAMLVWYELLKDIPYDKANVAIQKHMCSSPFPPTIADIRKNACEVVTDNSMNEMSAWNMVYKAICNSAYNADTEFEKLPPVVQRAVGSPATLREWSQMDVDTVQSVERSHFARNYREAVEIESQNRQMPQTMRDRIGMFRSEAVETVTRTSRITIETTETVQRANNCVSMPESAKERLRSLFPEVR